MRAAFLRDLRTKMLRWQDEVTALSIRMIRAFAATLE
jgi:isopenicillin N synthase-like dioxygenase